MNFVEKEEVKEIYVLVLVEYDYFRFQTNLYAGTLEQCRKEIDRLFTNYPVYTYKDEDTDLAKQLKKEEKKHYWLQKFEINENN